MTDEYARVIPHQVAQNSELFQVHVMDFLKEIHVKNCLYHSWDIANTQLQSSLALGAKCNHSVTLCMCILSLTNVFFCTGLG